jgi:Ca2+-binding RTX toxin-like protein
VSCGGDLANRLAPKVTALGGNGADSLTGGVFSDSLDGGNGNDQLFGGAGDDQLTGAGGADEIDGGAGRDTALFITTGLGLTVRLDGVANDGFPGEGDNYTSIEDVTGGPANDVLVGSDAAETLRGAAGNDQVTGGGGVDSLSGGDGDDVIDARDGVRDTVSCGSGQDEVIADLVDAVLVRSAFSPRIRSRQPECERVERFASDDGPPARAVGRRVRIARDGAVGVRVACPRKARVRCRGRLSLADPRRPGKALAAAAYDIRLGRSQVVGLELSAREAAQLRARGVVTARTRERGASKKGPRSSQQALVVR